MRRGALLCAVLIYQSLSVAAVEDQYRFSRNYSLGDEYSYVLMTDDFGQGRPRSTSIGEAVIRVVPNKEGRPEERVTWQGLTVNGKAVPRAEFEVPDYIMSLNGVDPIIFPKLDDLFEQVPDAMTGMVPDLLTYFVAVSPQSGITHVRMPGELWANPEVHIGNWRRKGGAQVGQDCTRVTFEMLALTDEIASYRASFLAPATQCLEMKKAWMTKPVKAGTPNNFVNIMREKNQHTYTVMWGFETFVIETWVDRASGKILRATMKNDLVTHMKMNCDASLDKCSPEFPYRIHRTQRLQLK